MNFTPYISANDLSQLMGMSNRSARRLMQKIVNQRSKLNWSEDETLLKTRNKCIAIHEVLRYTHLTQTDIHKHFEKVLNRPPSLQLRESEQHVEAGGKWHWATVLFETNLGKAISIERQTYSYVSRVNDEETLGVFGFGYTQYPTVLFCNQLEGIYGNMLIGSCSFKELEPVFYDRSVHTELLGYLSSYCGRKKSAVSVVVVEEVEALSEAAFHYMVDTLGRKLDRKRCLVFLPETMVPKGLRELERIKGFQKLDGTGFYIAGSIGRWVAGVKLKLRWAFRP